MRKPDIRCVTEVVRDTTTCLASFSIKNGRASVAVPARSYGVNQLCWYGRWKAAWLVFTGRADAVTYPGQ
jgi:hypothetical protein